MFALLLLAACERAGTPASPATAPDQPAEATPPIEPAFAITAPREAPPPKPPTPHVPAIAKPETVYEPPAWLTRPSSRAAPAWHGQADRARIQLRKPTP
ncbi:MAG TPA: hypothetical protein VFQ53_43160 [Kofleriaceae bacterium]|nr:hypothetical protein [Kofleriaceae bacterium]